MDLFTQNGLTCFLDPRLVKRYGTLIKEHINAMPKLAQGVKALSHHCSAWANTQAAWRFFNNEDVTFPMMSMPLIQAARQELQKCNAHYALIAHDWCRNNLRKHQAKLDKTTMSHDTDVGYELFASLLINGEDGQPLAPLGLDLTTSQGVLRCSEVELQPVKSHLDTLVGRVKWQSQLGLSKPLVHIIDREADSAGHLRHVHQMGAYWLTRGKADSTVTYQGESVTLESLALRMGSKLDKVVDIHGKQGFLFVGEAVVKLQRKSETDLADAPEVRFVASTVCDGEGKALARWYLLSNVMDVTSETLATWYYWRWSIESWFKVLKSHGFQLEHWQQASGQAYFRRLIVSSMACVLTWKLYNDASPEAADLKRFLIKLSGRLTKRSKPVTHPALLAGLWVFLQLNEVMATYSAEELESYRKIASSFFGQDV